MHAHAGTGGGGDTGSWVDFGAPEPLRQQRPPELQGPPSALLPGAAFGAAAGAAAVALSTDEGAAVPPTSLAAAGGSFWEIVEFEPLVPVHCARPPRCHDRNLPVHDTVLCKTL